MTDQELLDKFYKDHDNNLLGILFERYTLLLFGLSMKYLKNEEEAKDAVQQVFLKAITELKKYRVQYFKSWLYMVAKNHCLMKLRERNRFSSEIKEEMVTVEDISNIGEHVEKDKRLELMSNSIEQLNTEQKQCVTLFYLEKKSYQEISAILGYSILQVKSYIQNGKRNLKIIMEKKINKP
ncbi:MAG: sigma-70 family RNA polymerase sigma factor [Chitinophagaceae bacterium]|nr:sigma-70 family RNA polymerase sigma factor [Chitinophagaceae bacterium]